MPSLKWAIFIGVALAIIVSIIEHRRWKALHERNTMLNGIMPRIGRDRYPVSRDFGYELKCLTSGCPYNDKRGQCACPASVKIQTDGRCGLWEEFKAKEKGK